VNLDITVLSAAFNDIKQTIGGESGKFSERWICRSTTSVVHGELFPVPMPWRCANALKACLVLVPARRARFAKAAGVKGLTSQLDSLRHLRQMRLDPAMVSPVAKVKD